MREAENWSKFNAAFAAQLSLSCRGEDYYGQSDAANAAGYAAELAGECSKQNEHLAQTAIIARSRRHREERRRLRPRWRRNDATHVRFFAKRNDANLLGAARPATAIS